MRIGSASQRLFLGLFTAATLQVFYGVRAVANPEFKLSSPEFTSGEPIPQLFTADGKGISPPLKWSGTPKGTQELVLIVSDPDVARYGAPAAFSHWVVYGISPKTKGLPAALPPQGNVSTSIQAKQGKNSQERNGYAPPDPPRTDVAHHYHFKLFAIDRSLNLPPGLTENQVLSAIKGHVLGEAELLGLYGGVSAPSKGS